MALKVRGVTKREAAIEQPVLIAEAQAEAVGERAVAGQLVAEDLADALPEDIGEVAQMRAGDPRLPKVEMLSGQVRAIHPRYLAAMLYVVTEGRTWRDACQAAGAQHGSLLRALRAPGYRAFVEELTNASMRAASVRAASRLHSLVESYDEEVAVRAVKLALDHGNEKGSGGKGGSVHISISLGNESGN